MQMLCYFVWTNQSQSTNGDSCIFVKSFRCDVRVNDSDKILNKHMSKYLHVRPQLHTHFTDDPNGIVGHRDVLAVQIRSDDLHEILSVRLQQWKAGFR